MKLVYFFAIICFYFLNANIYAQTEQGISTRPKENQLKDKEEPKLDLPERRFLSLEKNGAVKRIRFYETQNIRFNLKNDPTNYYTVIQKVNKDNIMLMDVNMPLSEFERITVEYERFYPRLFEFATFIGGVGYFSLDMINNEFNMNSKSWQVPVSFLATAIIIRLIYPKKRNYKLNNQRYLKTIGY